MSAEIAYIFDAAAEKLSKRGAWAKGDRARRAGPMCLGFAVELAASEAGRSPETVVPALFPVLPTASYSGVIAWNDAPGRTQAEVVAKLREAAAKARGELP